MKILVLHISRHKFNDYRAKMQRKNRLAVFEHIAPKESRPSGLRSRRPRSPEYDIIITVRFPALNSS